MLRRILDQVALINRRARGLEPSDDAASRLRWHRFAQAPRQWLWQTAAKLAVVALLAALAAGLFAAGNAVMRAMGLQH